MQSLNKHRTAARLSLVGLAFILALSSVLPALAGVRIRLASENPVTVTPSPVYKVHMPVVPGSGIPTLELLHVWATTPQNIVQAAFPLSSSLAYHANGRNNRPTPLQADLLWRQSSDCGFTTVFTDTISLPPGEWVHDLPAVAPDCSGVITATVQVSYGSQVVAQSTQIVANSSSSIVIDNHHGFDRCNYPSVQEMQTWWNSSPYWVFNLYIGGSSFACRSRPLEPVWVHQVARQGWNFILTWVGPQAPCSGFTNRMSSNADISYLQGIAEANMAADAAFKPGILWRYGDLLRPRGVFS